MAAVCTIAAEPVWDDVRSLFKVQVCGVNIINSYIVLRIYLYLGGDSTGHTLDQSHDWQSNQELSTYRIHDFEIWYQFGYKPLRLDT